MQINLDFPKSIFSNVSKEVDSILKKLGSSSGDEQVSQAKNSAMEILGKLKIDIDVHIAALERHSEWDTFTIAFYGETNAGKSTII
jgi:tRNA U34 5-carboxymethylaminomethyl modifying GTPase MnmE/TrmE